MKIRINGQEKELTSDMRLRLIVERFCKDTRHVVAEVNGAIVRTPQWDQRILADGDVVELVNIVGGG